MLVSRRSETSGAKLFVTFAGGQTAQRQQITLPLASQYVRRDSDDDGDAEQAQRNAYRAAVFEHQLQSGVTSRVGLLLQNGGATTAEEVRIEVTIPPDLQLAFVEQQPPPKSVRKTPIVPLEPSPRSWRSVSDTSAHCDVMRVTSSVGLPPLFITLRDRAGAGKFNVDLKVTAARPELTHDSRLVLEFVRP